MTSLPAQSPWQASFPIFYGWIIVAVGFCGSFIFLGVQFFGLSVLAVPMEEDLGWSRSSLFLPLAVRGVMAVPLAPVISRLFDTPGGGRFLMVAGGVLSALSLGLISQVEEPWQFLLLFGVVGGIAGLGNPITVAAAIVPKWFLRHRGRAMAFATAGPGIAALTLPWSLALAEEALGWRGTWILLGGLSFVFTVVPGLLILRQPEDVGLTMDGGQARPEGPSSRPVVEASLSAKQAFGTRQAWQLLCAHSLAFLSIAVLPTTFVPLFVGRGLSLSEASLALVAYGITSTFARLGWGYLLDRAGVRLTAIALAAYAAFAIALFLPETSGVIVAAGLAAVAGYAIGGILVVYPLLWPTYFGRLHLGAINGIVTPVASMAASSGPLILAVLYDASGTYHLGLLLLVAAWAVSILPLYAARQRPVALNQVPSS